MKKTGKKRETRKKPVHKSRNRESLGDDEPVSLDPLSVEEALEGLLNTPPSETNKKKSGEK